MTELRWHLADAERPQGKLFDEPIFDREPGRGEFRGMEFLHVRAKTIINELPRQNWLPFQHTINAYRGCSHECSYCFARPTHSYLGLDTGEGFDRQIVVKVNAVSLLERELDPRRWGGHHIAMGTNTDPYQRCEGKYRLTRGIVEVLADHANPFSILTKSTLVLRDLDLLTEAAKRTDVRVNLSIGTLDEDVWRTTEPGTPNPRQRLRAIEALSGAGIPCGVLIAPVLPGLSDRPDQLEAVASAVVAAGADSVSTVMLHLRPGVREVFFERLRETHPTLVPVLERRYRNRANLPKADQALVSDVVRGAVRAAGGTSSPPREARHLAGDGVIRRPTTATSNPAAETTQLPLL